jgi:hypothetical protein
MIYSKCLKNIQMQNQDLHSLCVNWPLQLEFTKSYDDVNLQRNFAILFELTEELTVLGRWIMT